RNDTRTSLCPDPWRLSPGMGRLACEFRGCYGARRLNLGADRSLCARRAPRDPHSASTRNRARQKPARKLPDLDRNPALPGLRAYSHRRACRLPYLRGWRPGGIDTWLRHNPRRLRLLRFTAAHGLSRRQLSFQPFNAAAWYRRPDRNRERAADPSGFPDGRPCRTAYYKPLC